MKMYISRDAIRKRIREDGNLDVEAGIPSIRAETLELFVNKKSDEEVEVLELKHAFGTLIHQMRRDKGVDILTLAEKVDVNQEELCSIENINGFEPKPRTVFKLAEYFNLNKGNLMKLSGAAITHDKPLLDAAVKFAARSDDLSELSKEEREILNNFVKFLSNY